MMMTVSLERIIANKNNNYNKLFLKWQRLLLGIVLFDEIYFDSYVSCNHVSRESTSMHILSRVHILLLLNLKIMY